MRISFMIISLLFFFLIGIPGNAGTPACGSIITSPGTVIDFNADMVCPYNFSGAALSIVADNVTINGNGFCITGSNIWLA